MATRFSNTGRCCASAIVPDVRRAGRNKAVLPSKNFRRESAGSIKYLPDFSRFVSLTYYMGIPVGGGSSATKSAIFCKAIPKTYDAGAP